MNNLAISLRAETGTRVFVDLSVENRAEIIAHHMKLSPSDRRLRFMFSTNDEGVKQYIDKIDYVRSRVFGAYTVCGHSGIPLLVGFAHLTFDENEASAEIALSVDPEHRSQGHGFAIMKQAITYAKEKKCTQLKVTCESGNNPMYQLAKKIGLHLRLNFYHEYVGYLDL